MPIHEPKVLLNAGYRDLKPHLLIVQLIRARENKKMIATRALISHQDQRHEIDVRWSTSQSQGGVLYILSKSTLLITLTASEILEIVMFNAHTEITSFQNKVWKNK